MHAVQVVYVAVLPSSPMDVFSFSEPIGHFHGSFDFLAQLMFFSFLLKTCSQKRKKCIHAACLKNVGEFFISKIEKNRHNY